MATEIDLYRIALEEEKKLCKKFSYFFRKAWPELEPTTPLLWNWHLDYLCDICEKEARRIAAGKKKTKDIIVNICPRSLKSYIFAIMLNAWVWSQWPGQRFLTGSYGQDLAIDHATNTRRLIQSEWYKERWGDKFKLAIDQNTKTYFQNDKRGARKAVQTGTGTGFGGDWNLFDDPLNAEQAESPVYRQRAIRWLTKTMVTRLNQPDIGIRIIIMQRLHENDPTGYMLAEQKDKWHHICIPAIEDDNISPRKLRKYYKGGLFFPGRFSNEVLLDYKHTLKGAFAGQMLQKPAPDEGNVFKRTWLRFWVPKGVQVPNHVVKDAQGKLYECPQVEIPDRFERTVQSWDMAVKEKESGSAVAGHVWSKLGPHMFMRDRKWEHMDFTESAKAVKDMYKKWPEAHAILIENKANGTPVINHLQGEIPGLIPVEPTGSKTDRATKPDLSGSSPLAARMEAGNVWFPHPALFPWVSEMIEHFILFPNGKYADDIDSASQAAHHFGSNKQVWPQFNQSCVVPMNIAWDKTEGRSTLHYGAAVLNPDMSVSVLAGLWDAAAGKLFLYRCWHEPEPSMVTLAMNCVRLLQLKKYKIERLLCSPNMFSEQPQIKTPAHLLRKELKKFRVPQAIREPIKYDLWGSIVLGRELFQQRRVYVDEELCGDAAIQFSNWEIIDKKTKGEDGYCQALCLIISELNRRQELRQIIKLSDYKPDPNGRYG